MNIQEQVDHLIDTRPGRQLLTPVYDDPAYLKAMPSKEFVEAQQYMLTKGVNPHPQLISADYAEAADIISREMSNVVAGNKSVDDALADANKALLALGYKN